MEPAYQGELMLAGWTDNHNTGAKVTFWLPDTESLEAFRHLTVRKGNTAGQRFMAVLVQIGDDDKPIEPGSDNARQTHITSHSAALLCKSDAFQRFVQTKLGYISSNPSEREEDAAVYVREFCGIRSRSELDSNERARSLFGQLMAEYRVHIDPLSAG